MDQMDLVGIGAKLGIYYVPFLFALCFHEFSHGWVAKQFGDNTAERQGRLTMNPVAHADIMGTVILPIVGILFPGFLMFGWAKPVPVDARNMKNKNGMFWVALAGPVSNLVLAVVATVLIALALVYFNSRPATDAVLQLLKSFLMVNLALALFNLLPLHPLDGGKVIERFLPYNANRWLEENQSSTTWILVLLMMMGGFKFLAVPIYWMAGNLLNIAANLAHLLA
jgi:Zn-dependent protease